MEEDEKKYHEDGEQSKELHVKVDRANLVQEAREDQGEPGEVVQKYLEESAELLLTLLFTAGLLHNRSGLFLSGVGDEFIGQLGAQEAAGDDGEVLELGGGDGGLQEPELETQLRPGAEHQLGRLQAEHLLPPARVLLANEEEEVTLGHQLLHCLAASYGTADLHPRGQKELKKPKKFHKEKWENKQDAGSTNCNF